MDVNHSGFIEASEVRTLLNNIYKGKAPNFEVDAFVQFFDTNNDGKISWSEFERGLGAAMAQQNEANRNKLVQKLLPESNQDDDDDDVVEVEPHVSGKFSLCIHVFVYHYIYDRVIHQVN